MRRHTKETLVPALLQAAIGVMGVERLSELSERGLDLLWKSIFECSAQVIAARDAKQATAVLKLRLVADGGELTDDGHRIVDARVAARNRRAARRATA